MSIADWIIILSIAAYCLYLILRPKKPTCGGSCESCRGCKKCH